MYIIEGPCICCKGMCTGIGMAIKGACSCCNGCCEMMRQAWADSFGAIYARPMGGYVVFTWLSMIVTVAVAVFGLSRTKCDDKDERNKASLALILAIVVAVLHSLIAFYIQRQILKEIARKMEEEYNAQGVPEAERNFELVDNEAARKRSAIFEIIKYDFVFCFYFFAAPAAVAYAFWALATKATCGDSKDSWATTGPFGLLIGYGCLTGLYFFFLMCGLCCGAGAHKVKTKVKSAKGRTDAVKMGK